MNKGLQATRCSVFAVAVAILAGSCPALAQTQTAAADLPPGEIVVTAQKRETALQETPVSVTAVSGEALERKNASGLDDFLRDVPNVSLESWGPAGPRGAARTISMRGIVPGPGDQAFGLYLDELPIIAGDPKLTDINRVEVLRGPQGTLYGQGTSGGAIKIITNQPDLDEVEGSLSLNIGSIRHGEPLFDVGGAINLPIIDNVAAVRIVAFNRNQGGYVDRVALPDSLVPTFGSDAQKSTRAEVRDNVNDEAVYGGRIQLTVKPSSWLTFTPSLFYQVSKTENRGAFDPDIGKLKQAREIATPERQELLVGGLRADADLSFATLTSVTAYQRSKVVVNEDVSNLLRAVVTRPAGINFPSGAVLTGRNYLDAFTQEFRLASPGDQPFRWLVGVYYEDRDNRPLGGKGTPSLTVVAPGLTDAAKFFPFVDDTAIRQEAYATLKEKSVFGEISYDLLPGLTATAGLRYFDIKRTTLLFRGGFFNGLPKLTGNPPVSTQSKEDGFSPKFSLSYQANPDLLFFATVAKGFRRGGGNTPLPNSCAADLTARGLTQADVLQYEADKIWSYEVGNKSTWFNRRLTTNVTAYWIDWSDIQQTVTLPCRFGYTTNLGKARSRGFEAEVSAEPVKGFDLSLGLGYTDAQITEVPAGERTSFKEGQRLQNVPKWTVNASATYTHRLTENREAFVSGEFRHISKRIPSVGFQSELDGYEVANFRVGISNAEWRASLYVENAFDAQPILGGSNFGTISPEVFTLRPRTIGLAVGYNF